MDRPIAGGGFALMAWKLAQRRTSCEGYATRPLERSSLEDHFTLHLGDTHASAEYYRIIDKAAWHYTGDGWTVHL